MKKGNQFLPLEPVLMQNKDNQKWELSLFAYATETHFYGINGYCAEKCIPFTKETQHLLGTTEEWPKKPYLVHIHKTNDSYPEVRKANSTELNEILRTFEENKYEILHIVKR